MFHKQLSYLKKGVEFIKRSHFLLLCLPVLFFFNACQAQTPKSPSYIFEEEIILTEDGYSIRGLDWNSSLDEVEKLWGHFEPDAHLYVSDSVFFDGVESVRLLRFSDASNTALAEVEFAFQADSDTAYETLLDTLCEAAAASMPSKPVSGSLADRTFPICWESVSSDQRQSSVTFSVYPEERRIYTSVAAPSPMRRALS